MFFKKINFTIFLSIFTCSLFANITRLENHVVAGFGNKMLNLFPGPDINIPSSVIAHDTFESYADYFFIAKVNFGTLERYFRFEDNKDVRILINLVCEGSAKNITWYAVEKDS